MEGFVWLTLALGAGWVAFFATLSRILSFLRHKVGKRVVAILLLIGYSVGFGWLAWSGSPAGRAGIVSAWGFLLAAEIVHRLTQARLRATPPNPPRPPLRLTQPSTTTALIVEHYRLSLPYRGEERGEQPLPLAQSVRVAHMSDLHFGNGLPMVYYQQAAALVNAHEPDLILLGGDLIAELDGLEKLRCWLPLLRCRWGVYAILGNHDYWAGVAPVLEALHEAGVAVLSNRWQRVALPSAPPLILLGCEAPWNPTPLDVPSLQVGEWLVVLSHSADNIYRLKDLGAVAVFSGHYHAGQFQLPLFGPLLIPSRFGRRFSQGHFRLGDTHLFVSAGVGAAEPALRLYCPPDLCIVDFHFSSEGSA